MNVNSDCNFVCKPGYTEIPSTKLSCVLNQANTASWRAKPDCELQKCNHQILNEIYKFPIYAKFYLDQEIREFNLALIYISFNSSLKLPQYSVSLYDTLNTVKNLNRKNGFGSFFMHRCEELKNKITTDNDYINSNYHRGHLTSFDIMRFSSKAAKASNLLVNIAPQDPYSNKGPWKDIEDKLAEFLADDFAIIITGVCPKYEKYDFQTKSTARKSLNIPDCFWKLVCYKDKDSIIVFGFFHSNTKIDKKNDAEKKTRKDQIYELRDQLFIESIIGNLDLKSAWKDSEFLIESKKENFQNSNFFAERKFDYPDYNECADAKTFPNNVKDNFWSRKRRRFN